MSIELAAAKPHTHGVGEAPPKTKSQLLRSFEPGDFPALTGREEDWRFTPVKRLAGLDGTETAPAVKAAEYAIRSLPEGVTAEAMGKDDERLGSILSPSTGPAPSPGPRARRPSSSRSRPRPRSPSRSGSTSPAAASTAPPGPTPTSTSATTPTSP